MDEIVAAMFCYCVPAQDHKTAHKILENPLVKCFCMALSDKRFQAAGYAHPLGTGSYGLLDFVPAGMSRSEAESLVAKIPFEVVHEFVWHGTAEELYDKAVEYAAIGLEHLILWNIAPFDAADTNRRSFYVLDELLSTAREPE